MKMALKRSKVVRAVSCLACLILTLKYVFPLEASEFGGGRITGPLLAMEDIGALLFLVAIPLAFLHYRRIFGDLTLLGSLLCLPVYHYFAFPGPFRWVFRGEYSVQLQSNVVWEKWTMIGIVCLAIATSFGFRDYPEADLCH
jgi:hypothetical protein